ncbi:MAG: hypothetical protein IJD99_02225, partial [Clostridia bacterium]|nr:hypothetical protein [Clostridia bacterium]
IPADASIVSRSVSASSKAYHKVITKAHRFRSDEIAVNRPSSAVCFLFALLSEKQACMRTEASASLN